MRFPRGHLDNTRKTRLVSDDNTRELPVSTSFDVARPKTGGWVERLVEQEPAAHRVEWTEPRELDLYETKQNLSSKENHLDCGKKIDDIVLQCLCFFSRVEPFFA